MIMALSLGVRVGTKIYINGEPLKVIKLRGYERAWVVYRDRVWQLSNDHAVNIEPNVKASCGKPDDRHFKVVTPQPRINFEAPSNVKILREALLKDKQAYAA
jgi:hypothetical protein